MLLYASTLKTPEEQKTEQIESLYEQYQKNSDTNDAYPTPQSSTYTQHELTSSGYYDYTKEDVWDVRKSILEKALKYVGNIFYSTDHHGDELLYGGKNDASGFVSQVYSDIFNGKIYSNEALYQKFEEYIAPYDAKEIRPGDILLHGKGGNTLIYFGELHGRKAIIDCSADVVKLRYPSDEYLKACDYINMYEPFSDYLSGKESGEIEEN